MTSLGYLFYVISSSKRVRYAMKLPASRQARAHEIAVERSELRNIAYSERLPPMPRPTVPTWSVPGKKGMSVGIAQRLMTGQTDMRKPHFEIVGSLNSLRRD